MPNCSCCRQGRRRPHHRQERRPGAGAPRPPGADEADRQDPRAAARRPVRGDGRNRALLARRPEQRPPRPSQRRADAADGAGDGSRRGPPRPPLRQRHQHDRPRPRAVPRSPTAAGRGQAALADFYETWKTDNVVIDTWFAAQAQSPLAGTLVARQGADQSPAVPAQGAEQGAGPRRHLRLDQPGAVQPPRRRGLRLPRRPGIGARPASTRRSPRACSAPCVPGVLWRAGAGRRRARHCSASCAPNRCLRTCRRSPRACSKGNAENL